MCVQGLKRIESHTAYHPLVEPQRAPTRHVNATAPASSTIAIEKGSTVWWVAYMFR